MTKNMYNNDLLTQPQELEIDTDELVPFSFDLNPLLADTDTVSDVEFTVTRIDPNPRSEIENVVTDPPDITAGIVTQKFSGGPLQVSALYQIKLTFTAAVGKRLSTLTMLRCVS